MSLRLCIVNPFQHGGGAEYQISLLIQALGQHSPFDIYYLARHVEEPAEVAGYRMVRIGKKAKVPVFGYITDLLPLYRALRSIRPHVIYQRVACGYTGICAWYAQREGAQLIWHVAHDTDVMPRTLDTGRNFVRRRLEKLSVEFGLRHANRIVVQTLHQRELLLREYGRSADTLIPNFDREPNQLPEKSRPPIVAWVANIKSWKRPEVFVRLASTLSDVADARFVMMGAAPGGARDGWLGSLLQSMGDTPNLSYVGQGRQDEVHALLGRACIFVNTSLYEGFPNTFIQAWMRDTVVVSLDVDPDGVLSRQGAGICAGNEATLAAAVRQLLTDPSSRLPYLERARQYVRATHSLRNADRLVGLIEECGALATC
ncbi:MAG TPA: glycosyltransferase [Steroidobacteraceae bacterium]|jgi:glycosyltransferase involved in cell wall biosynthesis|nr:glycosyltransferase [Steroidobacteraceae bacterium]